MQTSEHTTVLARTDVAIGGASFAGLALALALAAAGRGEIRVVLVDQRRPSAPHPADPRAVALSHASQQMLEALDVWRLVAAEAQPISRIEISDSPLHAGVRPVLLAWDNTIAGGPASFIVPSGLLHNALYDAAVSRPGVETLTGAGIAGVRTGKARVEVVDGRGQSIVAARVVVGADGRQSAVRDAAGIKVVGWTYPQTGIVTRIAHERPHDGVAIQHFLPAGPFALLPLIGNRSCITWTEDSEEARRIVAMDDAGFMAELEVRLGGRLGLLTLDGERQVFALGTHLARRYVSDRLALIGDAAHGVHPLAGQGLNLALRDAAALAECIVEAMRAGLDPGDAMALERYESWRRFDSWMSAASFDGMNRLFGGDVTLVRSLREAGLQAVDRLPALKRMFLREAAGVAGELPRLLKGQPI